MEDVKFHGRRVKRLFTGYRVYGDREVRWVTGNFVVIPAYTDILRPGERVIIRHVCFVLDMTDATVYVYSYLYYRDPFTIRGDLNKVPVLLG